MRELDCDFCGGTAAGAYEILPAELDPSPDEQVRIVLCDSCRETLNDVLAPLLDRIGSGDASAPGPSFAADAAGHSSPVVEAGGGGGGGIDETGDDPAVAIDAAGHASPPEHSGPEPDTTDAVDAADAAADADAADDPAGDGPADSADDADAAEEPPNFRKVMRFLNNREFPVDRAEVAEFAAGAYDLEDREVRDIFDYAIERGILDEENGMLVKG